MSSSAPEPRLNLERKCRCEGLGPVRDALRELSARCEGVFGQVDAYYHARAGRLKLRVVAERGELIWYDRPDAGGVRASAWQRAVVDPASTHAVLSAALGVRGEVRKRREVYHYYNVRVHLDEVEGLGSFVEFEAVIDAANDEAISLVRLESLGAALGLEEANDVGGGYAELLGL